jgi:hypothetical protein
MFIRSLRWRAASALITAGAAAMVVLALAVPAGASTGPRYASAEQVGYAATGAQFDVVRATVYLRNPAQYAGAVGQYSHSVQLWSSGLVVTVGVSTSTSGTSYTPYAKIYDASSHQLLALNPAAEWCDPENNCSQTIGSFPAGDTVAFLLKYYLPDHHLILDAQDITPGADNRLRFGAGISFSTRKSFTQARVGTEFGSDPWTAPSSFTHPAAWTRIATYSGVVLATYSGNYSTLASWFVHHKIFMAGVTGSLIDVEAAPTDLTGGGASFQDWLAPAGTSGPAQPPAGLSQRPPR